jgi:hypothetical protein
LHIDGVAGASASIKGREIDGVNGAVPKVGLHHTRQLLQKPKIFRSSGMEAFESKLAELTTPETRELLGVVASVVDHNGLF